MLGPPSQFVKRQILGSGVCVGIEDRKKQKVKMSCVLFRVAVVSSAHRERKEGL